MFCTSGLPLDSMKSGSLCNWDSSVFFVSVIFCVDVSLDLFCNEIIVVRCCCWGSRFFISPSLPTLAPYCLLLCPVVVIRTAFDKLFVLRLWFRKFFYAWEAAFLFGGTIDGLLIEFCIMYLGENMHGDNCSGEFCVWFVIWVMRGGVVFRAAIGRS